MLTQKQIENLSYDELAAELNMIPDVEGISPENDRDLAHYEIDLKYQLNLLQKAHNDRTNKVNDLLNPIRKWAIESDENLERLKELVKHYNFL